MATPCPFCEKKGLPILPVRYGIAGTKTFGSYRVDKAPPDATQLLGPAEVPLSVPETVYTGRILRAGFLYVFYETYQSWEAYAVDSAGCLSILPIAEDTPPGGERFHDDCKRDATKMANASVVTIQDPGSAGKVWIGFSDAWWTAAIRSKNAALSAKQRAKFMRLVDVSAWYNHGKPGAAPPAHGFQIYQVDMIVTEYAMSLTNEVSALRWSPFPYLDIVSATALKAECDALAPAQGLVLALQDPAGIAQEIPAYMSARWEAFSDQWRRPVNVDANLTILKAAVERQAESDLYDTKVKAVRDHHAGLVLNALGVAGMATDWYLRRTPQAGEAQKVQLTAAELDKASTDAWGKYEKLIKQDQRSAFQKNYQAAAKQYDTQFLLPLAKAHSAWMTSAGMSSVFDHHFDADDINTGVGFTALFTACVLGTGGYSACVQLYDKWMRAGLSESNLFWRALLFNSPDLKSAAADANEGSSQGADAKKDDSAMHLPNPGKWSKVFSIYKTVMGKLKLSGETSSKTIKTIGQNSYKAADTRTALAELNTELGHKMVAVLRDRGTAAEDLTVVLGMHAGMPVRRVQVVGTQRDLYAAVHRTLENIQPADGGLDKADRAVLVDAQMAILEAEAKRAGVNLDDKVRWYTLLFDESKADPDALSNLTSRTQGNIAATRVLAVGLPEPQVVSSISADSALGTTLRYAKAPGVLASISLVFSVLGWSNAQDASRKALKDQEGRLEAMYVNAWTGLIAGTVDLVSAGIKSALLRRLPLMGVVAKTLGGDFLRYAKVGGAGAGAVGAWILVGVDAVNIYEATFQDGEYGVALLYTARFAGEGYLAFGLTRVLIAALISGSEVESLGPPAWIVTAVLLLLSVVIDLLKDPPTLAWTNHCLWGPHDQYKDDIFREQSDFSNAMTGH